MKIDRCFNDSLKLRKSGAATWQRRGNHCSPRAFCAIRTPTLFLAGALLFAGCSFAPHYEKPAVESPAAFKEMTPDQATNTDGWKTAQPQDATLRGNWWEMFEQPELNGLEQQITVTNNQTLAAALQNFLIARDIMKETRTEYFPTVSAEPSGTRSLSTLSLPSALGAAGGSGASFSGQPISSYTLPVDGSWQPDFWGSIRNAVKANALEAQATLGDLENMRLTVQGELAADYFQLRELDSQKQLLDDTVRAYQDSLNLERVLHKTGIASDQDVAQAETQLYTTQAQATDLGIQRAQTEHAIATLLGKPASEFYLETNVLTAKPIAIDYGVPSQLLERRPDIAAAERRVAEANAQIGVARAAFFPTVTLSGEVGFDGERIGNLSAGPAFLWSLGAGATETLFDAGRRNYVTKQAWATYRQEVADYRQTVLTAIQGVEDNLAALRVLSGELKQQTAAVSASQRYLALAKDRYRLGIDSYLNVITAQTTLLGNQRTELTLRGEQMTDSVQLIEDLGGGWDGSLTATTVAR
ncbi:MAG TPA: efflux transporter outer membrane subunit [Candidatus Acidoferrales bacterium]|nr:efflux transporter outer membrane subunit [Candidatus Acidoferrales bacterium]